LYQEWKEKNTKKTYVSETTQNDEEEVEGDFEARLHVARSENACIGKTIKLRPNGPIRFIRLWQLM